jgi:hypothetical protein
MQANLAANLFSNDQNSPRKLVEGKVSYLTYQSTETIGAAGAVTLSEEQMVKGV